MSAGNRPAEEAESCDGDDERLNGEEVADFMNGEPDRREGEEPEEEEG